MCCITYVSCIVHLLQETISLEQLQTLVAQEHTVVVMLVDVHLLLRQPRYATPSCQRLILHTISYLQCLPLLLLLLLLSQ